MADTEGRRTVRSTESIILILVVVAVLAVLLWLVIGRGDRESSIDVDINVPTQQDSGSPPS